MWDGTDCIETARRGNHGYGRIGNDLAHRRAYIEKHGPCIPPGYFVLHHCDNRPCKNWHHLFIGNARDNTQDMITKGRRVQSDNRGIKNPKAKITEYIVRAIRADRRTQQSIANEYGLDQTTISNIKLHKTWAHIL